MGGDGGLGPRRVVAFATRIVADVSIDLTLQHQHILIFAAVAFVEYR